MDKNKKSLKKVKNWEEEHEVDLVETFFSNFDLYESICPSINLCFRGWAGDVGRGRGRQSFKAV